jgi:hypothetical protein
MAAHDLFTAIQAGVFTLLPRRVSCRITPTENIQRGCHTLQSGLQPRLQRDRFAQRTACCGRIVHAALARRCPEACIQHA